MGSPALNGGHSPDRPMGRLCADFVAKVGSADGLWVILFNGDRL
jgi:hypothetical protein